jgi:hypothetical protein
MRPSVRILLSSATALLCSFPATAVPAHYLVFVADGDGVRPVFHRRVELDGLASPGEAAVRRAMAGKSRDVEVKAFTVTDAQGSPVFRGAVSVPLWVRGEFRGAAEREGGYAIEGHRFRPERTAFVVRVPELPGAKLAFDGGNGDGDGDGDGDRHGDPKKNAAAAFDLDALAAREASLPYAAWSRRTGAPKKAANSGNRVDVVILGDGYTAGQSAKFNADAGRLEADFFSIPPYKEYRSFVNVTRLFVASARSGADHPPYLASCVGDDPSCCADPDMLADPLRGTFVDTALGGRFCSYGIHRLAVVDEAAVLAAASAAPGWDRLFVLLNDTTYGGSGGSISVSTVNADSTDVARHEYGHSFTGLADEYETPFPDYPDCSDLGGGEPCEPNVTDQTSRAQIKWAPWIAASTPVPTPEGNPAFATTAGLYQGARFRSAGMYRHRDHDCLMNVLGVPFGEVCSQEYVRKLYRGGWGVPAAGIDPIEPGGELPRPGAVSASAGLPLAFSVALLRPAGAASLAVSWYVDGARVPTATGGTFSFTPSAEGTYTVEVRVHDATLLVKPAAAGTDLDSSRVWRVEAGAPAVGPLSSGSGPEPRKSAAVEP